jgi:superfamily I DNA/RNA helicase
MRLISPDKWIPVEIESLEPAADVAVRDLTSGIIVAGPGAGKTELLAQRACFLFQTALCPDPRRILAISFKRDAATNLRRRVRTSFRLDDLRFLCERTRR